MTPPDAEPTTKAERETWYSESEELLAEVAKHQGQKFQAELSIEALTGIATNTMRLIADVKRLEAEREKAIRRATYRVSVWAVNKVDAKFDVDWDMTAEEERELGKILREALEQAP